MENNTQEPNQQPAQQSEQPPISGPMPVPYFPLPNDGLLVANADQNKRSKPQMLVILLAIILVLIAMGGGLYYRHNRTQNAKTVATQQDKKEQEAAEQNKAKDETEAVTTPVQQAPTLKKPATEQAPAKTPVSNTPSAPNTTNCLPSNPSKYYLTHSQKTNSQYLQTNSYVDTSKLYAGLQFAGLINTINTKQYVVLAMSDTAWDSLTQAQRTWMNASPANMKSVLGWQIITTCFTWKGVNPASELATGTTKTVMTLNGPVTFTANGPNGTGLGTFDSGRVGIWDWFTSNGAVTIAGFVRPPQ